MESLLLGDSDDETTPASNVQQPMQPQPQMRQAPTGQQQQQQQAMSMSKADLSARLKSLYNPAMQPQQSAPQQQPMAMVPPTQPQRRVASQPVGSPPGGVRGPLVPNRPGAPQAAPLHPQQAHMNMAPPGHHRTTSQPIQTTQQQQPHSDPLEPTPLTALMQRTPSQQQQQQQQVMQQQQPTQQRYSSSGHRQSSHPQQQPVQYQQQQQQQQQRHVVQQQRQTYQHQQQQQQPNMMQPPTAGTSSRSSMPPPARGGQQASSLPTPLQASQGGHASSAHRSSSSGGVHRSSSGSSSRHHHSSTSSRSVDQQKRQKEQFLMFTRVLMKYLEQKDPDMHARAKAVIRECAEKNKKKEKGYESVTLSMQTRLRETVGTAYWERAGTYLQHFLKQKEVEVQRRKQAAAAGGSSSRGGGSSSSAAAAAEKMRLAEQQKQKMAAAQAVAEKKRQQQLALAKRKQEQLLKEKKHKLDQQREAQAKLAQIQRDNAAQIAKLQKSAPTPTPSSTSTATKKSSTKRPSASSAASTSKRTAAAAAAATPTMAGMDMMDTAALEPKEYQEWMESLDHMVGYDVTTAALLLQKKSDVSLSEEQKQLLYGSSAKPKVAEALPPTPGRGWHRRNIVNARCAWAIARKPEVYRALKARKSATPVVGMHSLPSKAQTPAELQQQARQPIPNEWLNEENAEQDMVLQILSEATQMYLKQVVKQGLVCARERENLDGIRLWHLQHAKSKPPLSLRLGCDVERQVAQAEGNAALTVKRMEEAILRDDSVGAATDVDPVEATSMSDLACKAPLSTQVVETADRDAKRSFEVYGGKHALQEPPFGRVPKRAKLSKQDLTLGLDLMSHHFVHSRPARGVIKLIM